MCSQNSCNRSYIGYFLLLLIKPIEAINEILCDKLSMRTIIIWLFIAGLLRGVLETVWLYLMKGQSQLLIHSLGSLNWYLFNSGPFVFGNITSAYFLWNDRARNVHGREASRGQRKVFRPSKDLRGFYVLLPCDRGFELCSSFYQYTVPQAEYLGNI